MCRCGPTARRAPAAAGAAWSSTRARRRCCARVGLEPGEDRVGLLAGRAEQGDAAVRRALHDAGTALGIALTGAVNLLDPENVVLGGALSGLSPWLLPSLRSELARRTAGPSCPVSVSTLGPQGPLLGAAHSVVRAVLDDPAAVAERG